MLNGTYKSKKLLHKIIPNKNTCPIGFVYVLFALGQVNKRIDITMALILLKLEKPDYVLWHYSKVHAINTSVQGYLFV